VCARVGGLVLRARPKTLNPKPCEPFPSAWTACGFGAQAFNSASAFNANIGAWNTARVTSLYSVFAASGPAARTMADALGWSFDAARPVVRGGTADARARAHTCRHSLARGLGCRYGHAEGRFGTRIRIYTYVSVRVRYRLTPTLSISYLYVRIGRRFVCVHQCAMGMDRLCAHALAGSFCGLGLKPETLNRASRARRRRPRAASARRRSTVCPRSTRTSAVGTPRRSPRCMRYAPLAARRRALWRTRSAGLRCGAAGCAQRHRRCARACAHVQALACAGPWV
jgi:hypothetical protein